MFCHQILTNAKATLAKMEPRVMIPLVGIHAHALLVTKERTANLVSMLQRF